MKKYILLVLVLGLAASAGAGAQQRVRMARQAPGGQSIGPGEIVTMVVDGSGALRMTLVAESTYWYEPRSDITTFELATLVPLFSGPSYGLGAYSVPTGRLMPLKDVQSNLAGGCVSGAALFRFDTDTLERLGTASRHFTRCQAGQ